MPVQRLAPIALAFAVTFVIALLCGSNPASAIVFLTSGAQTAGAGAGQAFLDAEAELIVTHNDGSTSGCSGSLLAGGQYVLTAAHCVTGASDNLTSTSISVNFTNTGLTIVTDSYVVDPVWTGNLATGGDLALIKLSTPVTSFAGYVLDTNASAVGQVVTLVGYGDTSVGGTGYTPGTFGTLYYGVNTYTGLSSDVPTAYSFPFIAGGGSVGAQEVMVAPGDSGGASLLNVGGTWEIVGVHDFISCDTVGCTPNSSLGQSGGDTSIYADQAWLLSATDAPEPASILVMAVGVLGLVALRRGTARRA